MCSICPPSSRQITAQGQRDVQTSQLQVGQLHLIVHEFAMSVNLFYWSIGIEGSFNDSGKEDRSAGVEEFPKSWMTAIFIRRVASPKIKHNVP